MAADTDSAVRGRAWAVAGFTAGVDCVSAAGVIADVSAEAEVVLGPSLFCRASAAAFSSAASRWAAVRGKAMLEAAVLSAGSLLSCGETLRSCLSVGSVLAAV